MATTKKASLNALGDEVFPPAQFLGFTLDLTTVQLGDISQITNNIIFAQQCIGLGTGDTTSQTVLGGTWDVPSGVSVSTDVVNGNAQLNSYDNGESVVSSLSTNSSLAASYQGVSGSGSVSTVNNKQYSYSSQYQLYVEENEDARAFFSNYLSNISNQNLTAFISPPSGSPLPFDATSRAIVNQYWNIFKSSGSHVITSVIYGGRFFLEVSLLTSEQSDFSQFQVDAQAKYNGILQTSVDMSVINTSQYASFSAESATTCAITGGDPTIAGQIEENPSATTPTQYQNWVSSVQAQTSPDVVSYGLNLITELMGASSDPTISGRQTDFQNAFNYIIALPYATPCSLVVNTDYATVTLDSAGYIVPADGQANSGNVNITNGAVNCRNPNGVAVNGATVNYLILNDGSPFSVVLKYGSAGQKNACFTVNGGTHRYGAGCEPNQPASFTNLSACTDSSDIYVPDGFAYPPNTSS